MRLHVGSVLALLAYSHSAQAAWPQHYRRQDQQSIQNGTYVPQRLPVASPTNYNVTSVTVTYAFVPETHDPTTTSVSTVEVVSSLVVIATYTKTTSLEVLSGEESTTSTEPVAVSSTATRLPYPLSGRPSQSFVVPGNGTYPTTPALSASQTSERTRATPRPKGAWKPKAENDSCGGATLNVLNAHLDYWYTETYTHTVSTVSVQSNSNDSQTGWTILPATTEFDISTAITQQTCGQSTAVNTAFNFTTTDWDCYTTPTPVASSTTLLSVDAYTPTNQTTGNGTNLPNIATEPPLAVATLPSAAGTYTEGTPFVYFSEYEIESSQPTTLPNGSEACAINTRMFMLNRLFSFAFEDDEGELSQESLANEDLTGEIHPNFLRMIGETHSVTPGTWSAEPTVIVVVERGVVAQAVLAMSTEVPGGELITPTPTLPNFLSSIEPTSPPAPTTYNSPRIEKTADSLDVPTPVKPFHVGRLRTFVAHVENSATTLVLPVPTDSDVITTQIDGHTVTATALSNVLSDPASGNGKNNGGSSNGNGNNANGGGSNGNGNNENGGGSTGNGNNANGGNGDSSNDGNGNEDVNLGTFSAPGGNDHGSGSNTGDDEDDWVVHPFVAHIENSQVTIDVPAPATQRVVTAAFQGKTLTATAVNAIPTGSHGTGGKNTGSNNGGSGSNSGGGSNGGNDGQNGGGGVFANLVSKIADAAKPTNALEVLSQAMGQGHKDATAAAIAAGIGGIAAGAAEEEGDKNGGSGSGRGDSISGSGFNSGSDSSSNAQPQRLGASPGQVLTVDGATITASPAQAFVIDGQTAVPGGAPITVDGKVISVPAATNAIVVDGTTRSLSGNFASPTAFDVDGIKITAQPGVGFPIAGQTLQAGGPAITVDGTRLSLAPGGTALIIGSSTSAIAAAAGAASEIPQLTVGNQVFTANAATQFYLSAGQTLTPGGTVVISGTTISLDSEATAVVINGQTRSFGSSPNAMITSSPELIRVHGQAYAPNAGGTYLISGQTLSPGGSVTVTGPNGVETYSLASSGTELVAVVSGHTITSTLDAAEATAAPILTIGGQTFTALPGSNGTNPTYLVNGELLTAGEEETVTVSGRTYVVSLSPEATLLEVEELGPNGKATKTRIQTLFPATATGRTSTMTASAGSGSGSGSGTEEEGTGVGAAPAQETGAASSSAGAVQLSSLLVAAGTLVLAVLL